MAKSKKNTPALGADYSNKMRSRYSEKVKPSGKIYTKSDRRENRVKGDMKEDSKAVSYTHLTLPTTPYV